MTKGDLLLNGNSALTRRPNGEVAYHLKVEGGFAEHHAPRVEESFGNVSYSTIVEGANPDFPSDARGCADVKMAEDLNRPGSCLVPAASVFVLGDNRANSRDSRFFGAVPTRSILGRALLIWLPAEGVSGRDWSRLGESIK